LRLGIAEVGFFAIFLTLVTALSWAWWRLIRSGGGAVAAFLFSVVLYHALLGDRALGFYSLLQDGQFNAGNVAAVGLVCGLAMMLEKRLMPAAIFFGISGAFHLNYSVVLPPLWLLLVWRSGIRGRPLVMTSLVAILPACLNVGLALPAKLSAAESDATMAWFVQTYVELRHPHHYQPLVWPWWVWSLFVLPSLTAAAVFRRPSRADRTRLLKVAWLYLLGLQVIALLLAGVWYVSETMIQMSLWRFSPHAKLLAIVGITSWLWRRKPQVVRISVGIAAAAMLMVFPVSILIVLLSARFLQQRIETPDSLMTLSLAGGVIGYVLWSRRLARQDKARSFLSQVVPSALAIVVVLTTLSVEAPPPPGQSPPDEGIVQAAAWARDNTPMNAKFLVPPGVGSSFPIQSRRSHVVSFKPVPQLAASLESWADRIRDVTGTSDLTSYVGGLRGYQVAQQQMDADYHARPLGDLLDVARRHDATHVLVQDQVAGEASNRVFRGLTGYSIYEVGRTSE
jgi:hypothetical protein